jgi:hypothetical protein
MMVANVDRGDVVVPYDGNAGQVVGGVVDVDTGLPVSTDYSKDKNIPIPSPDALNPNSRLLTIYINVYSWIVLLIN